MTTPDDPPRRRRVTMPTPTRTAPVRNASTAFHAPEAPVDDVVDEGVRNAYTVYEDFLRQGDEAAGRHRRGRDDGRASHAPHGAPGDAWWAGGGGDPAAMAWQFWSGMLRALVTIPAEMVGVWGASQAHRGHADHADGEGRWEDLRARHAPAATDEAPAPRVREPETAFSFELLTDQRVHVALQLPSVARLRAARVGPMLDGDGAASPVAASLTWNAGRQRPEVAIATNGAGPGVYTADVFLEGWSSPLGVIQVTIDGAAT